MPEPPRLEFHYQCACGKRMKGWAYQDSVIQRERDWWLRDHQGEGHGLMSPAEYAKSRRTRRSRR